MGERLTEREARNYVGGQSGSGSGSKYPWHAWTDGSWWVIRQGDDYSTETDSMRAILANHAKRHSMEVRVHRRSNELIFRFDEHTRPQPLV